MMANTRRGFFPSAALGLLLAVALVGGPGPVLGAGLKLQEAEEKVLDALDAPNPHFELDCEECHEGKPVFGKDTAATVKFKNGEAGNVDLCYGCHDKSDNIHPINVDPTTAQPPISVPQILPLERRGEFKGKVVCSTCHFIHTKTAGLKLLRGFPESSDEAELKKAVYKDRRDLCRGCHGAGLETKTPHKGKAGDPKSCAFCHATQPKEGEKVSFNKALVELCDFCHAATKGAHYLLVNPFADPNLKAEIAKTTLPTDNGEYTCVSCHDPHGGTNEPKYLRDAFVALAVKSARVRPHFQKSLCLTCHKVKPTKMKGEPGAQTLKEIPLLNDDLNKLCNRCHESGLSKANAHPLKPVTGKFAQRIPKDWPLQKGGLTCLSCHTAGDAVALDPANPSFVRGGPYENRNDVCWKCHLRDEFSALNPHLDIQQGEGCEFCHSTKPDLKKSIDVEKMKMKSDIVLLCIRCHDVYEHPANAKHVGELDRELMAKASIEVPKEFPLDARGRMTCATCHNPHVSGGGTRGMVVGMEICGNCHKR
jgi:predicted CXXCH cytochrome family protein